MELKEQGYRLAGMVTFLVLWEIVGHMSLSAGLFPPFSETFIAMLELLRDGVLIHHAITTLERVYTSFLLAAVLGISVGLVIGWSRRARNFFDFLIDFLRNVSSITLIPITILLVGIGFTQKVVVLTYAAFFPVALNTINGVAGVDRSKVEAARTMGATDLQIIRHVVVHAAMPSIFTGLRLAMGVGFVVVIATELVGATSGLGYYLHEASRTYEVTNMFAAALFVSILGYASSKAIVVLERYLVDWRDTVTEA